MPLRPREKPDIMNAIQEVIEKLAGAVMMADDDPQAYLSALCEDLIPIVPLLKDEHPRSAQLARGLHSIAGECGGEIPSATLEMLSAGIGLLQRLYAASQRGS